MAIASPPASAQSREDRERAQRAFDAGDRAEKSGDCATAVQHFEVALSIVETPQIRLRAGRCKEKIGKLVEALGDYQRGVALSQDEPELLALAKGQIENLLPRLSRIKFELATPAPEGLVITVDGKKVADIEGGQPANPGLHKVEARAPDHKPFEVELELADRETAMVKVVLEPRVPVRTPAPPPRDDDPTPWILLGASGATLGAAIGLGVYSFQLKQEAFDDAMGLTEAGGEPLCTGTGFQLTCHGESDDPRFAELEDKKVKQNVMLGLSIGSALITAGLATTAFTIIGAASGERPIAMGVPWFSARGGGASVLGAF